MADDSIPTLSGESLVSAILEFVEVVVHNVLYIRKLYPEHAFERRRIYEVSAYMARQPELNEYIFETVKGVQPWVEAGLFRKAVLVVLDEHGTPYERHVIELSLSGCLNPISLVQVCYIFLCEFLVLFF
jgi:mitotic spindle assembly checkpoint protein MAD2B